MFINTFLIYLEFYCFWVDWVHNNKSNALLSIKTKTNFQTNIKSCIFSVYQIRKQVNWKHNKSVINPVYQYSKEKIAISETFLVNWIDFLMLKSKECEKLGQKTHLHELMNWEEDDVRDKCTVVAEPTCSIAPHPLAVDKQK